MGANVTLGTPLIISGGQGGGGGSLFLGNTGAQGVITSFTLSGDIDTTFIWTPQENLINFSLEMIGAGGGGGGSAGRSSRTATADKVPTVTSQAAAGAGGGGAGGAYTKRAYSQLAHRGNVVYTLSVGASTSGGGNSTSGFGNTSPANSAVVGGTGSTGVSTSIAADIDSIGAVTFISTGGGSGGSGGSALLTSINAGGAQNSALSGAGGAGSTVGGAVTTNDITGLTLIGAAVDETGASGIDGSGTSVYSSAVAGGDVETGLQPGGVGGQAGGTEAQASGIGGATSVATNNGTNGVGNGNGPNGGLGNNLGGAGAGGSSRMQGTNTDAAGDSTSALTAESGGLGAPGVVKLTFLWSGLTADQPMDSSGTVIAPD